MAGVEPPMDAPWLRWEPRDVRRLLDETGVSWWISGGWALDLFLGSRSREHGDLDVSVYRSDFEALVSALGHGWACFAAVDGRLIPWHDGQSGTESIHSYWLRPRDSSRWHFEVLLEERDGDRWLFRRDRRIRRPLNEVVREADGVRFVQPEIQLLYKAKRPRPVDHADFERVVGRLSRPALRWLEGALARVHPDHAWLVTLREGCDAVPASETFLRCGNVQKKVRDEEVG